MYNRTGKVNKIIFLFQEKLKTARQKRAKNINVSENCLGV